MGFLATHFLFLRTWFASRLSLAAENLALRQQLAIVNRSIKRPKQRPRDRIFWVWLMRLWPNWRSALIIVQPEPVICWHRLGFRLYWRWKSQARSPGRPGIEPQIRALIRRMSKENPTLPRAPWLSTCFDQRIHLPKLGAHFWTIILVTWSVSTSLPYPQPHSEYFTVLSFSAMIAGG